MSAGEILQRRGAAVQASKGKLDADLPSHGFEITAEGLGLIKKQVTVTENGDRIVTPVVPTDPYRVVVKRKTVLPGLARELPASMLLKPSQRGNG